MTRAERWERQHSSLRDPLEIVSFAFSAGGVVPESGRFRTYGDFVGLLERLRITLLVTREYENLVVGLSAERGKLRQTFLPMPHPCGIAVDRQRHRVYLAATRNPNQIFELGPVGRPGQSSVLLPFRCKFYPGRYYFHDLALVGSQLHANSVGQNGVIRVDFDNSENEPLIWWPRCVERPDGRPEVGANHIQLNSIAAGPSLEDSYFSASSSALSARRPGHRNYAVDGRGVLFSGRTREVAARGLTRPHSARFHAGRVWVNNSGYGQLGYIEDTRFHPQWELPGWTRGLCIHESEKVAWVGISQVLPKFARYAPGLGGKSLKCGLVAVCLQSGRVLGGLDWPYGNQIFGIEWIDRQVAVGFAHGRIQASLDHHRETFYRY